MSDEQKDAPESPETAAPTPTRFQLLVGSLGAQVHMALGLIADPVSKEARVELDGARMGISLLEMLEVKTSGNLSDEESKTLGGLLAQLKMLYVQRAKEQAGDEAPAEDEG